MIQALVFDFDGLILDTESPDFESWQEAYREHGCELMLEDWADCIGQPAGVFNPMSHLESRLGRALDRETVRLARRRRFYQILERQTPRPGVEDYLRDARTMGLKTAVASSATRDWVLVHLRRLGLLPLFDEVRCFDDGIPAKPEPHLYLAAVAALGVQPEEAIAFEDSPHGVRAAKRAGLRCVAVPNSVTRRLCLDEADFCLDSLEDMPLVELLRRFNG